MLFFENAKESFESASGTINRYNSESEFYHKFAKMIPDRIDIDTLVLAFKMALQDAEKEGENTLPFIALVPQYVRQCTSPEFAHEFRKKYNAEVLGLTQEELPDVDYGCVEIESDVIDISDKASIENNELKNLMRDMNKLLATSDDLESITNKLDEEMKKFLEYTNDLETKVDEYSKVM